MRRENHRRHARFGKPVQDGNRLAHGARSIVEIRQEVAVDIDHLAWSKFTVWSEDLDDSRPWAVKLKRAQSSMTDTRAAVPRICLPQAPSPIGEERPLAPYLRISAIVNTQIV